jgi:NitT/TauT family transport system substrate-binding protein
MYFSVSRRRSTCEGHLFRIFQLALLAIIFLPVLAEATEPLKKMRFQLDWYPDAERGGYICAAVNGYYRAAGLDVQILPASPGVGTLTTLLSHGADLCMAPGDQILMARGQGLPVVAVMATMQHDPQAVMVHAESPVKTFADLDGHAIAIRPAVSWFRYLTQKYHLTHIRELPLNFGVANFLIDPNYIQQVFVTSEPYVCEQQHVKVRTLLIKDSGCDPYRVVATTDELLARDPAAVQAFVTASIRGWKTYLADPAATNVEIRRQNPEMTQGLLDFSRRTLIDDRFVTGDPARGEAIGRLDPARFTAQYKILRGLGIIPADYDYSAAYTTRFCNAPPP